MKPKLIVLCTMMGLFSMVGMAQETSKNQVQTKETSFTPLTPPRFIDQNKDGVCDNWPSRAGIQGKGVFIDQNGNGVCDNYENRKGTRGNRYFVDANKDGVCDNYQSGLSGKRGGHRGYRATQPNSQSNYPITPNR